MDETARQATRQWTLAQPAVSAFVTSIVRDFRDRDDVLQDIAIAVIESFESYDPQRPFTAWAMGIARNQVGTYLRDRRRERLVFDDKTVACLATTFAETGTNQSNQLDFLRDCIALLEERACKLLELRYQCDFKPAAIADSLGVTANNVAKSLQRIRDQLRECIERKSSKAALP